MTTTFHIRRPLRLRGGNNFYRDKSPRVTAAYCGGAMTGYDAGWRDKIATWEHPEHGTMTPCPECLRIRAAEGGARIEARRGDRGADEV